MREHYDFSKGVRNPYAKRLKKQLTIRLDTATIGYFKDLAEELAIPYQTLINMYLRDCAETARRPHWTTARRGRTDPTVRPRSASRAVAAERPPVV